MSNEIRAARKVQQQQNQGKISPPPPMKKLNNNDRIIDSLFLPAYTDAGSSDAFHRKVTEKKDTNGHGMVVRSVTPPDEEERDKTNGTILGEEFVEEGDKEEEDAGSNVSVMGSELEGTVIEGHGNISSHRRKGSNNSGITKENLEEITEKENVMERWKGQEQQQRPKTPPLARKKKFGMFPVTTPTSEYHSGSSSDERGFGEDGDEDSRKQLLLPNLEGGNGGGATTTTPLRKTSNNSARFSPMVSYMNPLLRARQCFSFDAFDSEIGAGRSNSSRNFSASPTKHWQKNLSRRTRSESWDNYRHFTPSASPIKSATPTTVKSPEPWEIEQQDAIDILACLVERSQSFDEHNMQKPTLQRHVSENTALSQDIDIFRRISSTAQPQDNSSNHESRMQTLDTLLKSHTYASEMKRAAMSASSWLKSVQREDHNPKSKSQLEQTLTEKEEENTRLNDELSKCRAEIGRLKSAARAEVLFTSPNRSILDDDEEDDDSTASSGANQQLAVLQSAFQTKPQDTPKTVRVQMLDSENFVTEWDPISPSLPPPPDHDLNSPIVHALLNQWTGDKAMHTSLLSWMEAVLHPEKYADENGDIPPLQIASITHEVKDGFLMHILPLLLRRTDIDLHVVSRAHRKTTYDLGVTVSTSKHRLENNLPKQDPRTKMAFRATKTGEEVALSPEKCSSNMSTASTTHTSNKYADSPTSTHSNHNLLSSIGNTVHEFLKPKKKEQPHHPHPYHRVVSVPPGRIGLTFVQFRGHAMISDISPESPLEGWVFPSDILIAVDEIPVSGMRVRDIVKLLQQRSGRGRALRVISSHGMSELTGGE